MVLGQIFCRFTGSAAQTHCAWRPQLVSKKFLEEEIFAGTNFRELAFDRENRENFCLAKISRYTVPVSELRKCRGRGSSLCMAAGGIKGLIYLEARACFSVHSWIR